MTPDFSYLKRLPIESYAKWIALGRDMTEEMFADALAVIEPPLLKGTAKTALLRELDPNVPRSRGRPPGDRLMRIDLGDRIERMKRPDIPAAFLRALVDRLKTGQRLTESARSMRDGKAIRRDRRDMYIKVLYREFYECPTVGGQLSHPIMGTFDLPEGHATQSKSAIALEVTHGVMRDLLGYDPPSHATMLNIISRKKLRRPS